MAVMEGCSPADAYRTAYAVENIGEAEVGRRATLLLEELARRALEVVGEQDEVDHGEAIRRELFAIAMGEGKYPDDKDPEIMRVPGLRERMKALELLGKGYGLFAGPPASDEADEPPLPLFRIMDDIHG